jgi:hypothetical protein
MQINPPGGEGEMPQHYHLTITVRDRSLSSLWQALDVRSFHVHHSGRRNKSPHAETLRHWDYWDSQQWEAV